MSRAAFIEPCLPSPADKPPSGSNWIHEIKHDGYRLMARRDPVGIRLITRRGNDWTTRFPLVAEAVNHLKVRSCLIDGEVVCCDERGVAAFHVLRHRRNEPQAFLYAFDLLELNGTDLRREPIEVRKATLASILRRARHGVRLNEHLEHPDGLAVFQHACKMGLEGIVSKRLGSRYRSGRSPDWLKFKNPEAPAVQAGGRGGLEMTILTLRRIREDRFEVTGPDIEPVTFKTRVEARDWCLTHYRGSPIREIGGRKKGTPAAVVATGELAEILERRPDLKGRSLAAVKQILRREARALRTSKTQK